MKKMIGFLIAMVFTLAAPAQRINILTGEEATEWINIAQNVQQGYTLTPNFILNPPAVEFPPDMMDTLKKYDWLRVAERWYNYDDWGYDGINQIKCRNRIERYQADGTVVHIISVCETNQPAEVYDDGMDLMDPMYVKDEANYTWLCWDTGNPNECLRIVYYQDGLLIIDVSDSGSASLPPVDYKRRIRKVYLALPKMF